MNKLLKIGVLGLVLGFALTASTALAAANLTFLTLDGSSNATVEEEGIVEAKVTFDVTSSTDVESMSWELVDSGLPKTCVNTVDRLANGTFTSSFDIDTTGASEGTWDVRINAYGDDGADASNLCETADQVDTQLFTDRLTVTDEVNDNQGSGNDSGTGTGSGSSKVPAWFKAFFDKYFGSGTGTTPTPAPTVSAVCTAYAQANVGTMPNTYSQANTRLQGFLLSQNASIPALAAGASFGFYGPQTSAAVAWFNSINHCS